MRKLKSLAYNKKVAPYLFLLPFLLSFVIFNLYPIISSFLMSFQRLYGFDQYKWVGLGNYKQLFNPSFWNAIKTTTIITLLNEVILIIIPLFLALILNNKRMRGRNVFRAIFFIPTLASIIIAGIVFRLMFSDIPSGLANSVLGLFGISPQSFMMNYNWSIFLMLIISVWRNAGLYMIYYLSGLQSIPNELYEAATIDGCGEWNKLRYVTIPHLKPISVYILTLLIFEGYRTFGESYVYWKEFMPGDIGLTIVRYLYQEGFTFGNLGFGSAIGFALLVIILVINMLQLKVLGLSTGDDD